MKKILIFLLSLVIAFIFWRYLKPYKSLGLKVDQVYILSLDRAKNRWEKLEPQLKKTNLSYKKFKAVEGLDLKIKDEEGNISYGHDLKSGKKTFRIGEKYKVYCPNITMTIVFNPKYEALKRPFVAGELGCICSHLEAWLDIVNNKYKAAIILEDDAGLDENFATNVKNITASLPMLRKWDIVYLNFNENMHPITKFLKRKPILFNKYINKLTNHRAGIGGFTGYLVNFQGASNLIDVLIYKQPINDAIDTFINLKIQKGLINAYSAKKVIVEHNHLGYSSIDETAKK